VPFCILGTVSYITVRATIQPVINNGSYVSAVIAVYRCSCVLCMMLYLCNVALFSEEMMMFMVVMMAVALMSVNFICQNSFS